MGEEDPAGGSSLLGRLIDDYGDELQYDLWCIGIDLGAWVNEKPVRRRTRLSPARLLAIIDQLPEDSATAAAIQGEPEYRNFGTTNKILAAIFDAVNTNTAVTGHWKKNKAPKFPLWPRPGVKPEDEEPQRPKTVEELHGFLTGFINGGGAHQI